MCLFALGAPVAEAAPTHPFLAELSQSGMEIPCGAATDSQGNLYVADYESNSVSIFSSAGDPITEFSTTTGSSEGPCALAVDSAGNVYVNKFEADVVKYKPSAYPPTGTTTYSADTSVNGTGILVASGATSVAVNPANQNVYVALGNHISSYQPNGTLISSTIGSGVPGAFYYGVDVYGKNGNVYATDEGNNKTYIFNSTGSQVKVEITGSGTDAGSFDMVYGYLAVDQSNGHVYVTDIRAHGVVNEFDSGGEFVSDLSHSFVSSDPSDIAVDNSAGATRGTVYVTSGDGNVYAFGPLTYAAQAPAATTSPATAITQTSATLNGSVDPNGEATLDCHFEWGTSPGVYGTGSAPCVPNPGAATEPTSVSANATGLTPHATYYFRVVETTAGGTATADELSFVASTPPTATTGDATNISNQGATLNGVVNPNGGTATNCRFQYVTDAAFQATGYTDLSSGGTASCVPNPGSATSATPVSAVLSGLVPGTTYHFRVLETTDGGTATGQDATFITTAQPVAETTGSPIRTATTALLEGRLNPRNASTTYRFEYGTEGPCSSTPCAATASLSAGSGGLLKFVSQEVTGLQAGTTYHYRLVADNGNPNGPSAGQDMTVQTRASDEPLSHGSLPGPPGSDRAWEQVNLPETGGNPVAAALALADDGGSAVYQIKGGTPISDVGTLLNFFFAERTDSGWQTRRLYPSRGEATGSIWGPPQGRSDLASLVAVNKDGSEAGAVWRLSPASAAVKIMDLAAGQAGFQAVSSDASRVLVGARGSLDPAHPVSQAQFGGQTRFPLNLYDISSGAPELISLLPDGTTAPCGVLGSETAFGLPSVSPRRHSHWISADGALAFFPSSGSFNGNCLTPDPSQLYVRDLEADTTELISGPPLSGPTCGAGFIKSTAEAAFFWTRSRLAADDTAAATCGGSLDGDVYRYDLGSGALQCVSCVGADADVVADTSNPHGPASEIAVAGDGSRVYFESPRQLLPGAAAPGFYRVNVATTDLRYVGPAGAGSHVGDVALAGQAITPDGTVIVFRSKDSGLNPLNGQDNGGSDQYYRYDDRDHSLICASCPQDGSPATGAVPQSVLGISADQQAGPNLSPLDDTGSFVFSGPTPLVAADQNTAGPGQSTTAGTDVYELRDGRPLLITDGTTSWPDEAEPTVDGITPSGGDVFFVAAARLTPDAPDAYQRLYDARIGGGFEFPQPPPPCALEHCQGEPKGAPQDPSPTTGGFVGPGNVATPRSCAPLSRRAKKMFGLARRMRSRAARTGQDAQARRLRKKAARGAERGRALSKRAKRCRQANRGADR